MKLELLSKLSYQERFFFIIIFFVIDAVTFFFFICIWKICIIVKFLLPAALFIYVIFNIFDLREYDNVVFLKETRDRKWSLWERHFKYNKPYRLKEFFFDLTTLSIYLREDRKNKWIVFFLCMCILFLIPFFFVYSLVLLFLTWLNVSALFSFIFIAKIKKFSFKYTRAETIWPNVITSKGSFFNFLIFLFVFNPQTMAFALVYLFFLRRFPDRTKLKFIFENVLFSRLISAPKWLVNLMLYFIYQGLLLFNNRLWLRKSYNFYNIKNMVFFELRLFLSSYCTRVACLIAACVIKMEDGRLGLNPNEQAKHLFAKSSNYLINRKSPEPMLSRTSVKVGGQDHEALGFAPKNSNQISAQSIKTFTSHFAFGGEKFKTIPLKNDFYFMYPRPKGEIVENAFFLTKYKDFQYVSASYVLADCVSIKQSSTRGESFLKFNERKALLLKAIELSKNKCFIEKQLKIFGTCGNVDAPSLQEYIVQGKKPHLGTTLRQEEVFGRLSKLEQEFLEEAALFGDILISEMSTLTCDQKLALLETIEETVVELNLDQFNELLSLND